MILSYTLILLLLTTFTQSQQQPPTSKQPEYSENINDFKGKQANIRTQKLLGCWLYIYDEVKSVSETSRAKVGVNQLPLFKQCLKKINRKQAILKITSLAEKNIEAVKQFKEIIGTPILPEHLSLAETGEKSDLSEFDSFLLKKGDDFAKELGEMFEKGNIKEQVEEEITKRQKYLFGFIPASIFTHATVLVISALVLMCCCTWCKFYRSTQEQRKAKRLTRRSPKGSASGTRKIETKKN